MIQLLSLVITAMIAENLLCTRAMGMETALFDRHDYLHFGIFTVVASTVLSLFAWVFDFFVFARFDLQFLRIFVYIPLLFAVVWALRFIPKTGVYLEKYKNALIFNNALLGVAVITAVKTYPVYFAVLYGFFAGVGYILALLMFNKLCSRISNADLPRSFVGMPSKLLVLALMSLASMAFIGGVSL